LTGSSLKPATHAASSRRDSIKTPIACTRSSIATQNSWTISSQRSIPPHAAITTRNPSPGSAISFAAPWLPTRWK